MSKSNTPNLAIFCDFENVAIGARDANYKDFQIQLVLERLLEKGNVVVKRAYSDWEGFKSAKKPMHEAAFEMIEIPHVSYSGKNSADIRMVVDALDLCYTKTHVDTFVLITGDSDFSPLVSKLRENNKVVVGVGVKAATSRLLIENCDDYIFYDDLVRRQTGRNTKKQQKKKGKPRAPKQERGSGRDSDVTATKEEGLELVLETTDSLFTERDENVWGSHIKQVIKRKQPHFSESFYGYRSFNELLEDAQTRGMLEIQKDEKSGGYLVLGFGPNA